MPDSISQFVDPSELRGRGWPADVVAAASRGFFDAVQQELAGVSADGIDRLRTARVGDWRDWGTTLPQLLGLAGRLDPAALGPPVALGRFVLLGYASLGVLKDNVLEAWARGIPEGARVLRSTMHFWRTHDRIRRMRNAFMHGTWCSVEDGAAIQFVDRDQQDHVLPLRYLLGELQVPLVAAVAVVGRLLLHE